MSSAIGGDVATALHAEEETEVPLPYEVHEYALEHFLLQVLLIVFISKILGLVLLWLKQPEVFGEILAGILIGVSGLGRIPGFNEYVFPEDSLIPLSIIAEIALMFTMFLIGEEIEIAGLQKKRVWGVALVGCLAAFGLGIGIAAFLYAWLDETGEYVPYLLVVAASNAFSALPVLKRMMPLIGPNDAPLNVHMLYIASIDDVAAWLVMVFLFASLSDTGNKWVHVVVIITFSIACYGLRLAIVRVYGLNPREECGAGSMDVVSGSERCASGGQSRSREREREPVLHLPPLSQLAWLLFAGVLFSGWLFALVGMHSSLGALLFGALATPRGKIHHQQEYERGKKGLEFTIVTCLLPILFASAGFKYDLWKLGDWRVVVGLLVTLAMGVLVKAAPTALAAKSMLLDAHLLRTSPLPLDDRSSPAREEEQELRDSSIAPQQQQQQQRKTANGEVAAAVAKREAKEGEVVPPVALPAHAPRPASWRNCIALAMLLDARGLVSFVTLNIASDLQIINGDTYFVLISMTLFTTAISWPCFSLFYKERAPVE